MRTTYKNQARVSAFQAPHSILNQTITGSRRFAAQSYSMQRIKTLSRRLDATVNDIVLAICSSALRHYLISQGRLPDQPLIALVPMSLRREDTDGGNQIAAILANLGTHLSHPEHRLATVKASIAEAKQRYAHMSPTEVLNYTALSLSPAFFHLATGMQPKWQAFNVVISNVPGPKTPLYWNGARLEGMYPLSIPVNRIALNITLISYTDQLEFGLTACRRTLPSMQRLLDHIETGIQALESIAHSPH